MPVGSLYRFLRRFVDIRPHEARVTLCLFLYFFFVALFIYIIKPVKENLLIDVTPKLWAYADLITAGLIGFVVALNAKLLNKLPRRNYFLGTGIFFVLNIIIFWLVFDANARGSASGLPVTIPFLESIEKTWPAPVIIFSFWSDIFIAMSVTHFWIAVNDVFNPYQAKRTVSFFVTGGLMGGILGSLLTSGMVHAIGPANLLLICPVILVVTLIIIDLVYAEQKKLRDATESSSAKSGSRAGSLESLRTIQKSRYLRILAGVIASAVIVGSLINYQFKITIKEVIPNDIARTSFLGSFFLAILLLSAIFHLVTTEQVLKKFGIRIGLLVAPSVLLLGSFTIFLFPAAGLLIWACFIKGSDKTFDNTISQSVRELLYVPIPADIKTEAKILIDTFINKFAVGLGAVLFWILCHVSWFAQKPPIVQVRELGIFVIVFALICIVLIRIIEAEYLSVLKRGLSRKWQDAHKIVSQNVDMDAARLIVDTLQSREKSSTLYAMNLFKLVQKEKLSPELIASLTLKEGEAKAHSMDSLFDVGGERFFQGIEEAMTDRDIESTVQEVMALDSYKSVMDKRLSELMENKAASETERMEAARLIGLMELTPEVQRCLERLLQDSSPDVLNYALDSATIHLRSEFVSFIIPLLGNPMIRQATQEALAAYGSSIEEVLMRRLQNEAEDLEVRRSIPEVLARFENQRSADILTMELARGNDDLEREIIDALYRIRSNQPKIHFKKKRILASILSQVKKSYTVYLNGTGSASSVQPSDSAQPWKAVLEIKVKRIFDLLTLIHPAEDIVKAYQNIQQGTTKSVDCSLELLDNILDRDVKEFLFPILEDLPQEEKVRRLKKLAQSLDQHLV